MARAFFNATATALAASVLIVSAAAAQTRDDEWARCAHGDPAARIAGCTALIQSGTETKADLFADFYSRGIAYAGDGQFDLALADYDRAVDLQPADPAIRATRCWARALMNQEEGALADCNESLRLRPNSAVALDSRGVVDLKMKNYPTAIADYDAALRLQPKLASSLYGRGLAKRAIGDTEGARADMSAAGQIDPAIGIKFTAARLSVP
jgi:tetratricopeptide (TPR) repeat protein